MHVYLRDEPVALSMRRVNADGLADDRSGLTPVAFFVNDNEAPSFRALLPGETLAVLERALDEPARLGLLAEEPEEDGEVRAMVGLSIPAGLMPDALVEQADDVGGEEDDEAEPWRASLGDPDGWRDGDGEDDPDMAERTVLIAFAPLVRIARKYPYDFAEELADLLEAALAGRTRPSLEARVDRLLGDQ